MIHKICQINTASVLIALTFTVEMRGQKLEVQGPFTPPLNFSLAFNSFQESRGKNEEGKPCLETTRTRREKEMRTQNATDLKSALHLCFACCLW